MKKINIFAAVMAVSLTSAALYAAPAVNPDANRSVTRAGALAAADARFAKMDANSDGVLNEADKAARVKQQFAKLDADKNGAISEAEFVAAREGRMEKREDRREKRMGRGGPEGKMGRHGGRGHGGGMKMLAMADANGDKAVSKAEFRAAAEARFAKADANSDGTISADERKAGRKGKWGGQRPAAPADAG